MFSGKIEPPIVSIVGSSGTGKTTLLEKLIPELKARGLRVGTIKHHEHDFEMDRPGKDSWRHKQAGAAVTVIASPTKIGMIMDVDHDYGLDRLMPFMAGVDIILTEGYKKEDRMKIEVFRPEVHDKPLCGEDKGLLSLVSDHPVETNVPVFSSSDIKGLADFLLSSLGLEQVLSKQSREAAS